MFTNSSLICCVVISTVGERVLSLLVEQRNERRTTVLLFIFCDILSSTVGFLTIDLSRYKPIILIIISL